MKVFKWAFAIAVVLGVVYIVYTWRGNRNYFDSGEMRSFTVKAGDVFQFKLSENASTEYRNCWINQGHCTHVEFVGKDYAGSILNNLGYVGAGGRVTFRFKGISKGVDTIAFARCPTGINGKDCSNFSIDSIKPDNLFMVSVK